MLNVVARMYQNGMNIEKIEKKSMMPKEFIEMALKNIKK